MATTSIKHLHAYYSKYEYVQRSHSQTRGIFMYKCRNRYKPVSTQTVHRCRTFFHIHSFVSNEYIYSSVSVAHLLDFKIERDWTNFETLSKTSCHIILYIHVVYKYIVQLRVRRVYFTNKNTRARKKKTFKTESHTPNCTAQWFSVRWASLQHPVLPHFKMFSVYVCWSLFVPIFSSTIITFHFPSFNLCYSLLFLSSLVNQTRLQQQQRKKSITFAIIVYYFWPIIDFNSTLVWISSLAGNVRMYLRIESRQHRKFYFANLEISNRIEFTTVFLWNNFHCGICIGA